VVARLVTFYVRQATKKKHNDLGSTSGPNYEGQLDVIELAGWRQRIPLPESSCFPGAGWRTTSLTQARLPAMKRLMMVYISNMARFRNRFPVRLLHVVALLGLLPAIESVADSKNGFALDGALVPSEQILHGGP